MQGLSAEEAVVARHASPQRCILTLLHGLRDQLLVRRHPRLMVKGSEMRDFGTA